MAFDARVEREKTRYTFQRRYLLRIVKPKPTKNGSKT